MSESNKKPLYKKVMIVDDNEIDRYIGSRNIKKYFFAENVILKESARAALNYLSSLENTPEELPQLIFLDIRMPEIDGFGFLEEYEKFPDVIRKNCIVMMLSTSLNPVDHDRVKNNQYVNRFINKPLDLEKLKLISPTYTILTANPN